MEVGKLILGLSYLQYVYPLFIIYLFFLPLERTPPPHFDVSTSSVKYLPGFGFLPFQLDTGYIGVGEGEEVQLFYYFVKSESDPETDPLILWITGGPGCSSLEGLTMEFGPLHFDDMEYNGSLPTLSLNTHSWTKVASIIFLDLPVKTGFSYATTEKANQTDNLQTGEHAYQFLQKWLANHSKFLQNPIYIGGDSYSGTTVPIVVQTISNGNDAKTKPMINLKGYILGNPLTINPDELNYRIPFAHGMGLLSDDLYKALVSNCRGEYQNIAPNNSACSNSVQTFNKLCEGINKEHILEPLCDSVSLKRYRSVGRRTSLYAKLQKLENSMVLPGVKCLEDWRKLSVHWANDDSVQEALHVRKGTIQNWTRCRGDLSFTYNVYNVVPYHANLSAKGYRSLIYSGDHDLTIPFISTEAWIGSLNYSVTDDWRKWIVNGQVAGYTKSYSNNLTFATVKGSGHVAPLWKPLECLTMLTKWISYKQL
ncbi:serine carboxypeptidase-like 7 [Solanum stenotomum]|uniref:serine carboxypeptidase-like 7 n=1 Tax=Solanum stenotomum TaxID=172797 RepID=UPI0020D19D9A|nr:serine carboxypeptidase-like 7 [Solanum stenotomum]